MDTYAQLIRRIIKEQLDIIGPIALDQARKVDGLNVSSIDDIQIVGNSKDVIQHLVEQYANLFGRASVEVCKEAIQPLANQISPNDIPDILKN